MSTFVFTCCRNGTDKPGLHLVQRVTVRAVDSRQAWKTFEAVYPFKRFTAFALFSLDSED